MSYVAILDTQLDPDAPLTSQLMYQMRDNPEAIALGLSGATRIFGEAIARAGYGLPVLTVSASDSFAISEGITQEVINITTSALAVGVRYTIVSFTGSIRSKISHAGTSGTSDLYLYKNNVLNSSFSTSSGTLIARSVDISVSPGDVLEWRHFGGIGVSSIGGYSNTASNSYVPQLAFRRSV